MATILLCCLAKLNDAEQQFLRSLDRYLTASGTRLLLLSPHPYDGLRDRWLVLPKDWTRWSSTFNIPEDAAQKALSVLDVELWSRRVDFFCGDPRGLRDSHDLLRTISAVARTLLDRLQPALVVSWNPPDPSTGILYDLAKADGRRVATFERGLLPQTLSVDPKRFGIRDSLSDLEWSQVPWGDRVSEDYWALGKSFVEKIHSTSYSRYEQRPPDALLQLSSGRFAQASPRVLVLGNYDMACGFSPGDPLLASTMPGYSSGFELAKAVAVSHAGLTVFKPHPVMTLRLTGYDTRGVSRLAVGLGNPVPYLEWAEVVVSYGSTLEYAALAMGKPLVLAARSSLFGKSIAHEALDPSQLTSAITAAQQGEDANLRQYRFQCFVGFLIEKHSLRIDGTRFIEQSAHKWAGQLLAYLPETNPTEALIPLRNLYRSRTVAQRLYDFILAQAPRVHRRMNRLWARIRMST